MDYWIGGVVEWGLMDLCARGKWGSEAVKEYPFFQHIELNRHLQAVLHELDIALQCPDAHFKRARHLRAIGILPVLNHPMNPHHPPQGRPPMRPECEVLFL